MPNGQNWPTEAEHVTQDPCRLIGAGVITNCPPRVIVQDFYSSSAHRSTHQTYRNCWMCCIKQRKNIQQIVNGLKTWHERQHHGAKSQSTHVRIICERTRTPDLKSSPIKVQLYHMLFLSIPDCQHFTIWGQSSAKKYAIHKQWISFAFVYTWRSIPGPACEWDNVNSECLQNMITLSETELIQEFWSPFPYLSDVRGL